MRILHTSFIGRAALLGVGAALAAGCVVRDAPDAAARATASASMSVACEPSQRAVVHPAVVNGVTMSQVECVSVGAPAIATTGFQAVSYTPPSAVVPGSIVNAGAVVSEAPVSYTTPRVVPATYTAPAPRRSTRVRDDRRQTTRSAQKSALIIGGSAGAGAGLGAAIGGKKGALVGAILGGGGATLWDQITRRR